VSADTGVGGESGEVARLRSEVQRLRDQVMSVHVELCRNGPGAGRRVVEQRNAALRSQLAAGHAQLNEVSKQLDHLLHDR
jgi:hypothetical protein